MSGYERLDSGPRETEIGLEDSPQNIVVPSSGLGNGHAVGPSHYDRSDDALEFYENDGVQLPDEDSFPVRELSLEERKRRWWRDAIVNSLFMLSWFTFATLLSLYNKWMFSPEHFGFPFPLFVTTMHMFVQFALAGLLRLCFPRTFKPTQRPTLENYGKKAVPCAVTTGADIGLSNLSLKTITLSFYTMCKSSSLIFVLLFAFLFRLESFSWRLVSVILIITGGVVMMVATETQFVIGGMLLVFFASALGGLRWALTQILLSKKEMGMDNPAATVFWLAPSMGVTLAILSTFIEGWGELWRSGFFDGFWVSARTVGYVLSPGVLAFTMVMSEYYIIQRVGMVPMSIAGIFKEVTTITLSTWVFGDNLTPINMVGVAITVSGIGLFTYHKYQKSIHSPEPLDEHGNPIAMGNVDGPADNADEYVGRALSEDGSGSERERLGMTEYSPANHPMEHVEETPPPPPARPLSRSPPPVYTPSAS